MTVHEKPWGDSREWFTPPELFDALDLRFDLDPASPMSGPVPWVPADRFYSPRENGLTSPWEGRVWLNPPYGPPLVPFVQRLVHHGDGVLLVPARTETRWFQYVAGYAHGVTFLRDRLYFTREDGFRGRASHASVVMSFGPECTEALRAADLGWTPVSWVRPRQVAIRRCKCGATYPEGEYRAHALSAHPSRYILGLVG